MELVSPFAALLLAAAGALVVVAGQRPAQLAPVPGTRARADGGSRG
ncbi:MAG: hypothetical protein MUD13_09895 [Candidatus Nanopelagicales bacterium]|nr:hypothetical protein [Candidatus Nanopelagicales bacterium]